MESTHCMDELLWGHMFPSQPSVGSIRDYKPYSLSFFSIIVGPPGRSASVSWPPCELYVLVCNIPSTLVVLESLLHCEFTLQKFNESHVILHTVWIVCSVWVCSSTACLLGLFKGVIYFCYGSIFIIGFLRAWFSCFTFWWQLELHCPLLAWSLLHFLLAAASSGLCMRMNISVIGEMKGWLFVSLVAVLLFLGGYITFTSRY